MRTLDPRAALSSLFCLAVLLAAVAGAAQQAQRRTILGQVLDEDEKLAPLAIVHLKNLATKAELSVVTDKNGRYQFNDVDMKVDNEIYAEKDDQRSRTRTISQFDTRARVTVNLTLEPPKKPDEKEEEKGEKKGNR